MLIKLPGCRDYERQKERERERCVILWYVYEFGFHYNNLRVNYMPDNGGKHNEYNVFLSFRDLSHSRSMSFPEKKSYNPHVNIEYVDDKGRELTPKEVMWWFCLHSEVNDFIIYIPRLSDTCLTSSMGVVLAKERLREEWRNWGKNM